MSGPSGVGVMLYLDSATLTSLDILVKKTQELNSEHRITRSSVIRGLIKKAEPPAVPAKLVAQKINVRWNHTAPKKRFSVKKLKK